MSKNTTKANEMTKIAKLLETNSHYAKKFVNKDNFAQFDQWKKCNNDLLVAFYSLYVAKDRKAPQEEIDKATKKAYETLTTMLHFIGKVNGFYITTDATTTTEIGTMSTLFDDCLAFSHRFVTDKHYKLQLVETQKRNDEKLLKQYEKQNGVDKECIEELANNIETLQEKINKLYDTKDMAVIGVSVSSLTSFMHNFEKRVRQVMQNQLAKSFEEIQAERKAKEEERKARRNKSKSNKKSK